MFYTKEGVMLLTFRRIGNSTGLMFPAAFLKEHHIKEGVTVDIVPNEKGELILKPQARKRYTAAELNAQCDLSASMPDDLQDFQNAPKVGNEAL